MTEAYVYAAARTPFGRFGGALATVRPDDLAAFAVTGVLGKVPALDPGEIGDVVWGNANGAGEDDRNVGRMAVLLAGLPAGAARGLLHGEVTHANRSEPASGQPPRNRHSVIGTGRPLGRKALSSGRWPASSIRRNAGVASVSIFSRNFSMLWLSTPSGVVPR